jgi:hypothetical protein
MNRSVDTNSRRRGWLVGGCCLGLAVWPTRAETDLFTNTAPARIRLEIPAGALASLRQDSRAYVRATFREGGNSFSNVALRLKGRTGSFRPIEDKPAFTVSFDHFTPGRRFDGLSKIHLNNSVEDPSYLHERLGAALSGCAEVPAPRVAHAVVELNGRRLGLYVLKEGFTEEFLARHFSRADGNLFEPEPGAASDVTGPMRRSSGAGAADGSDLRRLASVTSEPDLSVRWQRLGEVLDRDGFLAFLAMETLSGHRDGYGLAKNNYRLYHDPAADRFVFLPGGMDQLLGRARFSLQPRMAGLVARSILEIPAGREAYRVRLAALFTNCLQVATLTNQVRRWAAALAPHLPRAEARALLRESADLCLRLEQRAGEVARQLAIPTPAPLRFVEGVARLQEWLPLNPPPVGRMDQVTMDGRNTLHLEAGPTTTASWRTKAWLTPGRYRFEARARVTGVRALSFGRNHGAFLSVPGRDARNSTALLGDCDWTLLRVDFDLAREEAEVELLCMLRAKAGDVWFDMESLRLLRTGP